MAPQRKGLPVSLNIRESISLGEVGAFGGSLYRISQNMFINPGALSINISF